MSVHNTTIIGKSAQIPSDSLPADKTEFDAARGTLYEFGFAADIIGAWYESADVTDDEALGVIYFYQGIPGWERRFDIDRIRDWFPEYKVLIDKRLGLWQARIRQKRIEVVCDYQPEPALTGNWQPTGEIEMSSYTAAHTVDESGARLKNELLDFSGVSLEIALEAAEYRTKHGQCGFVRRDEDGAILMPDGSWSL